MTRLVSRLRRRPAEPVRWPVRLAAQTAAGERVLLRPLRPGDEGEFLGARAANSTWLGPWDATSPLPSPPRVAFREYLGRLEADARRGTALPFVLEVDRQIVGQLNVSSIVLGSFRSCTMGYWVIHDVAGRGLMPAAVALAGDHVLRDVGLHRVEINIRPENSASLAVVRKLGLRDEGLRKRYLHIDGDWRDHRSFAITAEELEPAGLLGRVGARRVPAR